MFDLTKLIRNNDHNPQPLHIGYMGIYIQYKIQGHV